MALRWSRLTCSSNSPERSHHRLSIDDVVSEFEIASVNNMERFHQYTGSVTIYCDVQASSGPSLFVLSTADERRNLLSLNELSCTVSGSSSKTLICAGSRYMPLVEAVCLERGFEMDGGSC